MSTKRPQNCKNYFYLSAIAERDRLKKIIKENKIEVKNNYCGSLAIKKTKGIEYVYLVKRQCGKLNFKYLGQYHNMITSGEFTKIQNKCSRISEKRNNVYNYIRELKMVENVIRYYEKESMLNLPGYIYILKTKHGYKIGRTIDIKKRLSSYTTALLNQFECVFSCQVNDHVRIEKELHLRFKDKHISREWFNLNERDIEQVKSILTNIY